MTSKVVLRIRNLIFCCLLFSGTVSQAWCQKQPQPIGQFFLNIHTVCKDSGFALPMLSLKTSFTSEAEASSYVGRIPRLLISKGYPAASVDSIWQKNDTFYIDLFLGQKYQWVLLNADSIEPPALESAGFFENNYNGKPVNIFNLQLLQNRLLDYYEKHGYPFSSVFLDSIQMHEGLLSAQLVLEKSVIYHIDSIRLYGKARLNAKYLQRYLDISNGSIYNKAKLQQIDSRMAELQFLSIVQPSDITMLGAGAVVNVYAEPKKSSQVNFLVGILPASSLNNKLQFTGDVNLDLRNVFGNAESILVKWQQLQPQSPRINLGYSQPYMFNSPFGGHFLFDLFKKDSNFLQVNAVAGIQYYLSLHQFGKLYMQWQNNILLAGAVDTNRVKLKKELPANIDMGAVNIGFNYEWISTNYRFNPRKGNELNAEMIVGIKTYHKNADIAKLKEPSFDYASLYDSLKAKNYQLRLKLTAAHYFPISKSATFKAGFSGGYYTSPNVFRNDLFQIGGYKLLRGFNEESIYASRYAACSAEYRYLIGLNSYLFTFADGGLVKFKYQAVNAGYHLVSAGIGMLFETKAGMINVSYALGKRNDVKFNIKEASKLHFGFINYF
jgi:outer membrane protein assembly factor BamA